MFIKPAKNAPQKSILPIAHNALLEYNRFSKIAACKKTHW